MLLLFPPEILLQILDQLTPSDLATLCTMPEFAYVFHHITDQGCASHEHAYFQPSPGVKRSHLYSDPIVVDTSRYYLIEVKGAQSLVVVEGKTQFTRRVICCKNSIDDFHLDLKTVVKPREWGKKYVLQSFPHVVFRKLEMDPKIVEVYDSTDLSLFDVCSIDDTFKMKIGEGLKHLTVNSSCHETSLSNIDFTHVPSTTLTLNFPYQHHATDLTVGKAIHVTLTEYDHLYKCILPKAQDLSLTPKSHGGYIFSLSAPELRRLSLRFTSFNAPPCVDSLFVPSLEELEIVETSNASNVDEREIIMSDQYGIARDALLMNPGLWQGLRKLKLEIRSGGVFEYTPLALQLQELEVKVCDELEAVSVSFPELKTLTVVIGAESVESLPLFDCPQLEKLVIRGDVAGAAQLKPYDVGMYGGLQEFVIDGLSWRDISSLLSTSSVRVDSFKLLRCPDLPRRMSIGDSVKRMEIQGQVRPGYNSFEVLGSRSLEELVCHLIKPEAEDEEFLEENDRWNDQGEADYLTLSVSGPFPSLETLVVKGISGIILTQTPSIQSIIHGGLVDLNMLDCDDSVRKLERLWYKNKSAMSPIQSVTYPLTGLDRRVTHTTTHPRPDAFTH